MEKISFWKFLSSHNISIPILQRDYAQGRLGNEYLRLGFLTNIEKALKGQPLTLDFVYGSSENNKYYPLDGQQRLTTLWLLHWYLAFRTEHLNEQNVKDSLQKFSYETRASSSEFCAALCRMQGALSCTDVVKLISSQSWFFSVWNQDPTIQSMLRMLGGTPTKDKNNEDFVDGIEELFKNSSSDDLESYWNKLTGDDCPISFYDFDLDENSFSDDLYIKMNARGKTLTPFENFKADFVHFINANEWESLKSIPVEMDISWTDVFWPYRCTENNHFDEIYFDFLNRYFLDVHIVNSSIKAEDMDKNVTFKYFYNGNNPYALFKPYDFLKEEHLTQLLNIFANLPKDINSLVQPAWNETEEQKFNFIPIYTKDKKDNSISIISQPQRVVFWGVCKYFATTSYEESSFKKWMRVVWNLVENANIQTIPSMVGAMRLINELSAHVSDILPFLASKDSVISSTMAESQMKEEREKSCKILESEDWKSKIEETEKYSFFHGAIRFLFTDETGKIDWTSFDIKWENAQSYFDKGKGLYKRENDKNLLRRFISYFSKVEQFTSRGFVFDSQEQSWRSNLLSQYLVDPVNSLLKNNDVDSFDYKNFKSSIQDWKLGYLQTNLVSTSVLLYLEKNSYLHTPSENGYWLLRPYNVRTNRKKYIANPYYFLLNQDSISFVGKEKEDRSEIMFGDYINFKYNGHFYQWFGYPDKNKKDIYLMKKDWNDYQDKDRFCFSIEKNETPDSFVQKLDKLNISAQMSE